MTAKFVDTNIFIEILMRKGVKSDKSLALLEKSTSLWTTDLVIAEIEWVLRDWFELPKSQIANFLKRILSYQNIDIACKKVLLEAISLYESQNADFTDCANAVVVLDAGGKEVYSYDKHFSKFPGIKRLEP